MLRSMALLFALVYLVGIPAMVAFVLAMAWPRLFPQASYRTRTIGSASGAGCLPMVLPALGVLLGYGYRGELVIPLLALAFVGLLIALLVGLPVATLARRGKEEPAGAEKIFD